MTPMRTVPGDGNSSSSASVCDLSTPFDSQNCFLSIICYHHDPHLGGEGIEEIHSHFLLFLHMA